MKHKHRKRKLHIRKIPVHVPVPVMIKEPKNEEHPFEVGWFAILLVIIGFLLLIRGCEPVVKPIPTPHYSPSVIASAVVTASAAPTSTAIVTRCADGRKMGKHGCPDICANGKAVGDGQCTEKGIKSKHE